MNTIQISSAEGQLGRRKLGDTDATCALAASLAIMALFSLVSPAQAQTQAQRPNIVIIWGDDIGQSNVSAYSHGLMGYKTPNIDRIAKEGVMFTDYYGEPSCTAGSRTLNMRHAAGRVLWQAAATPCRDRKEAECGVLPMPMSAKGHQPK